MLDGVDHSQDVCEALRNLVGCSTVVNMAWQPTAGWLLVEKITTEDRIGSIYITPKSQERIAGWTYEVQSSGGPLPLEEDDEPFTSHDFQGGDWILAPPRRTVDYDEEGLLLLPESEAWAVIL